MRRRDPADLGTYYRQVAERLVPESTVNRAAKLRLYRPGHHAATNPPLEDGEATSGALRLLVNKFRGELEYDLDMVGDYRNLGLFLVYFLLLLTVLALQRQVGVGPLRRQYASVYRSFLGLETGVTYDASMEANAVVEHWDAAVDHVRDVVMPRRPVWTTSA